MTMPHKALYAIFGWAFFATGVIGAFLPVLPTTPFMILALWMFSKSSQRFHDWLYHHKLFGPSLQRWQQHRVIPLKAKLLSVSMISFSLVLMLVYSSIPPWAKAGVTLFMLYGAAYVLSKPSQPPGEKSP
ncbi:YbaN family protein [Sulfuriflexus mobilis]|uniref:YbaN family protein n=1 Tax=Sulfuriflexus mobilis TaxID=1811807 RepID=UPI000F835D53|nr:YbaN family protein [Sulfuriflexus mobilis]